MKASQISRLVKEARESQASGLRQRQLYVNVVAKLAAERELVDERCVPVPQKAWRKA
jgi:hypothetical protein